MDQPILSASEKAAASRILTVLDRHTLALKLTGAYAAFSQRSLESIATDLESDARVASLEPSSDTRQNAVRLAFQQSVANLPVQALVMFSLLAAFESTDIGKNAVLEVAETVAKAKSFALDRSRMPSDLDSLVNYALVDARLNERIPLPADRDRLVLHPMLRVLADDLLNRWSDQRRRIAYRAVAHYYAQYINVITDRWLAPDEENIIGALEWAHDNNEQELVATICDGMCSFWHRRGRARTSLRYLLWGKEAANKIAKSSPDETDHLRVARLTLNYGAALRATGNPAGADSALRESLALYRDMKNRKGEALVLSSIGLIAKERGRLSEAWKYFHDALTISEEEGDEQGQAANRMYLGQVAQARGQISIAQGYFQQAGELFKKVPDPDDEGSGLTSLAQLEQAQGHWREAEGLFQQSLSIVREHEDLAGEAVVVSQLGQLALARGELDKTEIYLKDSLALRLEVEDRYGEAGDLCQYGKLCLDRGYFEQSKVYFEKSLALFRDWHARADEAAVISQLALLAIEQQHHREAQGLLKQSLSIRQEVQDPRGEGIDLALLGRIALEKKDFDEAESLYSRSLDIAREIENRRGEGVNLRQLAVIATERRRFQFAEEYFRASLDIAREVENGLDIADASFAFGSFLCELGQRSVEGCSRLHDAEEIYVRMTVPGAQKVHEAMQRFGCK
jgi:tetratricopeptide (TPR) repeat protein